MSLFYICVSLCLFLTLTLAEDMSTVMPNTSESVIMSTVMETLRPNTPESVVLSTVGETLRPNTSESVVLSTVGETLRPNTSESVLMPTVLDTVVPNTSESVIMSTMLETTANTLDISHSTTLETMTSTAVQTSTIASVTSSTTKIENNEANEMTTSLWELIYPEQNSTVLNETSMPVIDHTLSMPMATKDELQYGGVARYFKVDDVANCEKYFGECLRQVLAKVMPKLRNGDNDTRLPTIDPFYVNRTSFQYKGGPLNGRITVAYAYVYGLSAMKYRKVIFKRITENTFKIRLSTVIPHLLAKGTYKADLKLNTVHVKPTGDFNITLYGMAIEQLAVGEFYERDEHKFLKINSLNVTASLRDAKINATGLIADLRLNEIILNVANQYWREIFNIVLPETRDNWSPIISNALNGVLAMVPFDFLKKF